MPTTRATYVPRWTWGDRVRKVRRDLKLEQEQFARMIGVTQKTLASWETGARTPRDSVALAQTIEAQTGVPAIWMLGLDEPGLRSVPGGTLTSRDTLTYRSRGMRTRSSLLARHSVTAS